MGIPTYEELMLPLLKLLSDKNTYTNKQCNEILAKQCNLTEEEKRETLPSKKSPIFYNRVNWAKTYMKKAGLVEAPKRGEVRITNLGQQLLNENPNELKSKDLQRYDSFVEFTNKSNKDNGTVNKIIDIEENKTPEESLEDAFLKLKISLADELLEKIHTCSFDFFERLVIDLLIKMGYGGSREEAGQATKKTGDGGIDGIINEDRLGLDSIYIQAKRWKDAVVGRPEIQKFSGALDTPGATKGIFITTSTFTKEAKEYAKNINNKKIVLIDGSQLAKFMIDFNVGVSLETVYEIKKIDSDYFIEE
ncbi:MAG: restriction endonuclease [Paraclostridium sp.]